MKRCLPCARVAPVAALTLALAGGLPARAAEAPAGANLADALGVPVDKAPVRERAGWRPPRIVLVAPYVHDHLALLQAAVPQAKLVEMPAASPRDIANADVSIGVCTEEVLKQAKHLEWIQWPAAGVERCVQQPLLHERHILLTNLQRAAGPSMAEHVIAMMLLLSRHLDYYLREQQRAHWAEDGPEAADLEGKTLLVVGLGGIGTEVARRAHAFGMRVTATRASGRSGPDFVDYVGLPDELPKLARDADYVVNCAPLTAADHRHLQPRVLCRHEEQRLLPQRRPRPQHRDRGSHRRAHRAPHRRRRARRRGSRAAAARQPTVARAEPVHHAARVRQQCARRRAALRAAA